MNPIDAYRSWLAKAARGDEYVYHSQPIKHTPNTIGEIRHVIWGTYERGIVALAQRRRDDGGMDYVAQRR
jgi:hypothetical protein